MTFGAASKQCEAIHKKGFPGGDKPPPPHWTLLIQTSLSCVSPPLKWNSSQHSWADIHHRLQDMFSTILRGQINQLQLELHQQFSDIKRHNEQKVFQTLHNNLQ